MQTLIKMPTPAELADRFIAELNEVMTRDEWLAMLTKNREYIDAGESGVCASHDFLDANMVMDAALRSFGIDGLPDAESEPEKHEEICRLWSAAWRMAMPRITAPKRRGAA